MADVTGNDRIHLTVDEARALGDSAMRGALGRLAKGNLDHGG